TTDCGEQLRPRAEVAPPDIHGTHGNSPIAGRTLHDRSIDGQRLEAVIRRLEPGFTARDGADHGHQTGIPLDRVTNGPALPQADAGVPCDTELGVQLAGAVQVRLLLEALQRECLDAVDGRAGVVIRDRVAVFGRGVAGLD